MFASGVLAAGAMGAAAVADGRAFGADAAELGPLEWRVVALARREADRFGRHATAAPGALRRLIARATGLNDGVARLADARLEALRRFVCMARRADRRAGAAAGTLADQGFSEGAILAVASAARR